MLPHIVHIVRRFGLVGGMETYVWHLVHGLADQGYPVVVVCEVMIGGGSNGIEILYVKQAKERPRWKSMLTFRERVDSVLQERFKGRAVIIHSHERSLSHQVTTFHGPPINITGRLSWLKKLSPRIRAWREMEFQELFAPRVQWILPVSSKVQKSLLAGYPGLAAKKLQLAWPGVTDLDNGESLYSSAIASSRFLFVGKEWKRKGLGRAIDIVERVHKNDPHARLDVYGVDPSDVPRSMLHRSWITFKGWSTTIPWADYDALIHPAINEPFGMVVVEARAEGVGVLISDKVGAADLRLNHVHVVALDAPLTEWVSALKRAIESSIRFKEVKWSWANLVDLHSRDIYPHIEARIL